MKPTPQEITVPQCGCVAKKLNPHCFYLSTDELFMNFEVQLGDEAESSAKDIS